MAISNPLMFARPEGILDWHKPWRFHATVVRVIDGDTIEVEFDLGFKVKMTELIRLKNIDTEELRSSDPERRERAEKAKTIVENMVLNKWVQIDTTRQGKYGRWLGVVWFQEGQNWFNLGEVLHAKGLQKKPAV